MNETTSLIILNVFPKDTPNPRIRTVMYIGTSKYNPWHEQGIQNLKRNLQRPAIKAAKKQPATWADITHAHDGILHPYGLKTYNPKKPTTVTIDGIVSVNLDENEVIGVTESTT